MPSPEGDKGGKAIGERRAQDVEASDNIIVHGTHPSFGAVWFSLLLPLRQRHDLPMALLPYESMKEIPDRLLH